MLHKRVVEWKLLQICCDKFVTLVVGLSCRGMKIRDKKESNIILLAVAIQDPALLECHFTSALNSAGTVLNKSKLFYLLTEYFTRT